MNIAIILAGGRGTRLSSKIAKQFIEINNKPILFYSIKAFNENKNIDEIVLVTNLNFQEEYNKFMENYPFEKIRHTVIGGNSRQKSVFNALKFLKHHKTDDKDVILIHDSARAMIDSVTIDNCLEKAIKHGASTAVQKTNDTIISSDGKKIISYLDRKNIYKVQTPQCFRFDLIYNAHVQSITDDATDDTYLVKKSGHEIYLVISNNPNIKITSPDDIQVFETYLKNKLN